MSAAEATAEVYVGLILIVFTLFWEREKMIFLLFMIACAVFVIENPDFNFMMGQRIRPNAGQAQMIGVFLWWVFYKPFNELFNWFGWREWLSIRSVLTRIKGVDGV